MAVSYPKMYFVKLMIALCILLVVLAFVYRKQDTQNFRISKSMLWSDENRVKSGRNLQTTSKTLQKLPVISLDENDEDEEETEEENLTENQATKKPFLNEGMLYNNLKKTVEIVHAQGLKIKKQQTQLEELEKIVYKDGGDTTSEEVEHLKLKVGKLERLIKRDEHNTLLRRYSRDLSLLETKPYKGMKIVHLDLKGSPPQVEYLVKFMLEAKKYGANGFLIEYEDMFPWHGKLEKLRRATAYSQGDIKFILEKATELEMEVIPLIQTFGHFEFVLKYDEFKYLRRVDDDIKSINAAHQESVPFVQMMLDQVIEMHKDVTWFHVGGDEVEYPEQCEGCDALGMSGIQIYQHHMVPILKHVKSKRNSKGKSIVPIIWDDMMRHWSGDDIKVIMSHAVPMVWSYVPDLTIPFSDDTWVRYEAGFPDTVFFASSFKGATLPETDFMDVTLHIDNHIQWLKIITMFEKIGRKVEGIALTGWSRFMHTMGMCELLPVGTPSLAICLEVLRVGKIDENIYNTISNQMGIPIYASRYSAEISSEKGGNFLGADVYKLVDRLVHLRKVIGQQINLQGDTEQTIQIAENFLRQYDELRTSVLQIFPQYFFEDTIKEWVDNKIDRSVENFNATLNTIRHIHESKLASMKTTQAVVTNGNNLNQIADKAGTENSVVTNENGSAAQNNIRSGAKINANKRTSRRRRRRRRRKQSKATTLATVKK